MNQSFKTEPGVIPAFITPLDEEENIDIQSLERLVEHLLRCDFKAFFLGGTIGEGGALADSAKSTLYRETVRLTAGRLPVFANISDQGTRRVLENLKLAVEAGVDAVVVTPRLTFLQRMKDETVWMMESVAKASPVPVWFYENPEMCPVSTDFETLLKIAELPNIGGFKLTIKDRALFRRCIEELPGTPPCFNGVVSEITYAASVGGGAISGIASLLPELCIRVFNAGRSGDAEEADRLQAMINDVYRIYGGNGWPLWPAAQKHVLMRLGIFRTNIATGPFRRLDPAQELFIDEQIEQLDPSVFAPAVLAPANQS